MHLQSVLFTKGSSNLLFYSLTYSCIIMCVPATQKKQERAVWQRRFWEHQIRDENDLQRHVDYVHYNPVKHKLVKKVEDWPWSTYHRFVREGFYGRTSDLEQIGDISAEGFGE